MLEITNHDSNKVDNFVEHQKSNITTSCSTDLPAPKKGVVVMRNEDWANEMYGCPPDKPEPVVAKKGLLSQLVDGLPPINQDKPDVESEHKDQMFEGLVEPLKHGDDGLSDNRKNSNTVSDVQTSPKEPATAQPLKPWWKWWGKKTPQKTKCVSFNDDMRDESSSNPISSDGSKHNLETEPSKPWWKRWKKSQHKTTKYDMRNSNIDVDVINEIFEENVALGVESLHQHEINQIMKNFHNFAISTL